MDQEKIAKLSILQNQGEEIRQQLDLIDKELAELINFRNNLNGLKSSNENIMLSTIGKGVFMKTQILDRQLFVEVGKGVVVKKSPEEVYKIVGEQINKFSDVREKLMYKFDVIAMTLQRILSEIEENGPIAHECRCGHDPKSEHECCGRHKH